MTQSLQTARPGWKQLFAEAPAVARLVGTQLKFPRRASNLGAARPVLVLPGFLGSDIATGWFRRNIAAHGFRVYGWEQGLNSGADAAKFANLLEWIDTIHERNGKPLALVGWSLGGLYARELAWQRADKVSLVITLGTPFSRSARLNNAVKFYEAINDHRADRPPVPLHMGAKPPVHTVAMWSQRDGIVAPAAASGKPNESDETVELHCRHHDLVGVAEPATAVIDVLARWAAGSLVASDSTPRAGITSIAA